MAFPKNQKNILLSLLPHTSWIDFPIAILARMSVGTMVHFIGKGSLFKFPFGYFFRALGGTPVDRTKSNKLVDAVINLFNSKEEFRLALSPEGTRKKVAPLENRFLLYRQGCKGACCYGNFRF